MRFLIFSIKIISQNLQSKLQPVYENIHPWWFVVFCNIVLITTIMMLGDITAFPCSFSFPTALSRRKMSFSLEKHFSYKRHHNNSEPIWLIFHFVGLERIIAGEVFVRVSLLELATNLCEVFTAPRERLLIMIFVSASTSTYV